MPEQEIVKNKEIKEVKSSNSPSTKSALSSKLLSTQPSTRPEVSSKQSSLQASLQYSLQSPLQTREGPLRLPKEAAQKKGMASDINSSISSEKQDTPSESIKGQRIQEFRLKQVTGHKAPLAKIFIGDWLPNKGQELLSIDQSGLVLFWTFPNGKGLRYGDIAKNPDALALSHDQRLLAGVYGSTLRIYSLDEMEEKWSLDRLKTNIVSLAFHPTDDSILLGGADARVYRWKFRKGSPDEEKNLERYVGHSSVISSVVYHPGGRVFFSGDWKGNLSVWLNYDADPFDGKYDTNLFGTRFFSDKTTRVRGTAGGSASIDKVLVTGDGEYLFLALQSGVIEVWAVRGFKKIAEVQAHKGLIYDISINSDGKVISSVGRDGKLRIWNFKKTGSPVTYSIEKKEEFPLSEARTMVLSNNQKVFAGDGKGRVLEVAISPSDST